jgi:hypothetical protein
MIELVSTLSRPRVRPGVARGHAGKSRSPAFNIDARCFGYKTSAPDTSASSPDADILVSDEGRPGLTDTVEKLFSVHSSARLIRSPTH